MRREARQEMSEKLHVNIDDNKREVGSKAPDFSLLSVSQKGEAMLKSSDLLGKAYILYFYPKAGTTGCTIQACSIRDKRADGSFAALEEARGSEIPVFGVSPDSPKKLARFIEKNNLNFPLLSDETSQLAKSYGIWGEKKLYGRISMGIIRSCFLINETGYIEALKKPISSSKQAEWIEAVLKRE